MTGLGPNALQRCGTRGALVRHRAHGQLCPRCEPLAERPWRCPVCAEQITLVGVVVTAHDFEGVDGFPCPAVGRELDLPAPTPRRILPDRPGRVPVRAVA